MSDRMQKQAMQKFFNYMRAYSYPYKSYNSFYPQGMATESLNKDADKQKKSQANQYMPYGYPSYSPYSMPYPPQSFSMEAGAQAARLQAQAKHKSQLGYGQNNPYSQYYHYYNSYYPYSMYSSYFSNPRSDSLPQKRQQRKQTQVKPQNHLEAPQIKILSKPPQKAPIIKEQIVISSDSEEIQVEKPIENNQRPHSNPLIIRNVFPQKESKPISEKRPSNMQVIIEEQPDAFYIRKKLKSQKQAEKAVKLQREKIEKMEKQKMLKLHKAQKIQKEKQKSYLKNQKMLKNLQKLNIQKEQKIQNGEINEKEDKLSKTKTIYKPYPKNAAFLQKDRYHTMPSEAYQQMLKKQSRQSLQLFHQRQKQRQLELLMGKQQKQNEKQPQKNSFKYANLQMQKKQPHKMFDQRHQKDWPKKQQRQATKRQQKQILQKRQEKEVIRKEQKKPPVLAVPVPILQQQKQGKKERIRDDHPLKQLRYNQSHGRIRLGIYFQSNIPNLMRNEDLSMRRLELQRKLRERQVSAVTF